MSCGLRDRDCQTARTCPLCLTSREKVGCAADRRQGSLTNAILELSSRPDLIRRLIPPHAEPALRERGIEIEGFQPIPVEQLRISLDVSTARSIL